MSVQVVIQHQSSSLSSVESTNNNNNNNTEEEEVVVGGERKRRREEEEEEEERERDNNNNNLKLKLVVGLLFTAFRKSVFGCSSSSSSCHNIIIKTTTTLSSSSSSSSFSLLSSCGGGGMEIGVPTNVRHVAHVTFDRFNGFLGLPVEFQPHVPTRPPSASTRVFGVSTNSMQLSFDTRGNSVPTILLLMQHRLYALGGLQAEGVFRINPDNGREEHVRDQLNRGLIPEDVDVHCLAGLIKAWFRELPSGVLDCLTAEQVMESQTEEDCLQLVKLLPPTEADLLDWAVNLMADVAHFQHLNKMNPRNVAMVFAPNMTHMADPLTALMHAVQVMNFLKTLIERRLKEREEASLDTALDSYSSRRDPSADNNNTGCHTPLQTIHEENHESEAADHVGQHYPRPDDDEQQQQQQQLLFNNENINVVIPRGDQNTQSSSSSVNNNNNNNLITEEEESTHQEDNKSIKPKNNCRIISGQSSTTKKGLLKKSSNQKPVLQVTKLADKTTNKGSILATTVKLKNERIEAWR